MRTFVVLMILLVGAACESDTKKTAEVPTPVALKVEPASAKPAKPAPVKAAPVVISGTPHDEEHAKVSLAWKAKQGAVDLYAGPDDPREMGSISLKPGQALKIEKSAVMVIRANPLIAQKGAKLFGAGAFDAKNDTIEDDVADLEIPEGKEVGVLKYAGEGTCYVSYAGKMYYAGCPSDEHFTGNFKLHGPAEYEWWIKATGSKGWLKVDDRIEVKVSSDL